MGKDKDDLVWECRDGREIPLEEMHAPHMVNARAKLGRWLKGESDPDVRRDLAKWRKIFTKQLVQRRKEWLAKRRDNDGQ